MSESGKLRRPVPIIDRGVAVIAAAIAVGGCTTALNRLSSDWPAYQGGVDSNQYSALRQINRDNVDELELAWTYNTGDADAGNRSQIQCNPIIVDGVLYGTSAGLKLFALNAATGERLWEFDPFDGNYSLFGFGVNRGVAYWEDGDDRRLYYGAGAKLYAVNAADGSPAAQFGDGGSIDLHEGLGRSTDGLFVTANTPGVIFEDLLILGHRAAEANPAVPGHVRAFDVRTGQLVWTFHTIPNPGEAGYETWPPEAWRSAGGANAWAGISLDPERGVVYVPTGSATYDFFGGDRIGQNLYANSIVALDARTGERIWHYQTVHHDLWDRDLPAPPNLLTLEIEGRRIDALAQITKSGHVFVLDRESGAPLFPIDELAVPESGLPGESAWPTQPVPTRPPPFARQRLTADNATRLSDSGRRLVLERLARLRSSRAFEPPSREGTIILPGFDGGGEWGGAAADPATGTLYVNASEMPWVLTMVPARTNEVRTTADAGRSVYGANCVYCHGVEREGDALGNYPALTNLAERRSRSDVRGLLSTGAGRMPAFGFLTDNQVGVLLDYLFDAGEPLPADLRGAVAEIMFGANDEAFSDFVSTGYQRFVDDAGYPAIEPPWGTLTAIDLEHGELRWQVTLGELDELTERGIPPTGTENYGGPLVTAGGIVFIAATKDEKFRAFDKDTGLLLAEWQLPAGGYATPATYAVDGRQFVVVAAGGGKMGTKSGDAYIAFALP